MLAGVTLPTDPTHLHGDMHSYLAGGRLHAIMSSLPHGRAVSSGHSSYDFPQPLSPHQPSAGCGVDGVKVDVQSTIGLLGGSGLSAAYHASLEDSIRRHFPGNLLLNCMCHSSEDLYRCGSASLPCILCRCLAGIGGGPSWPAIYILQLMMPLRSSYCPCIYEVLPCAQRHPSRMEDSNLARVSDDFYPSLPPSHTAHIANCAYNSLWMGEIVIPDWDMWHSRHDKALLHATARAVSGAFVGPTASMQAPAQSFRASSVCSLIFSVCLDSWCC